MSEQENKCMVCGKPDALKHRPLIGLCGETKGWLEFENIGDQVLHADGKVCTKIKETTTCEECQCTYFRLDSQNKCWVCRRTKPDEKAS